MPLIQSRKYPTEEHEQFVSADVWKQMQAKGLARRYRIIDDGDLRETVIPAPENITKFDQPEAKKAIEVEKIDLTKKEIIEKLDELGVDYNTKDTKTELLEILNNQ